MLGLLENSSTSDLEQGAFSPNGCLLTKSNANDSSQNVTYTWNDEDRLTRVQGPGVLDVSFSYDSMGRMLSKTKGSQITHFTWDGWDCVQESVTGSPIGSYTIQYVIPNGQLHSAQFVFGSSTTTYQVHADALGSVRMVTDPNGNIVAKYEYDAWGNVLSGTDPLPGGFPYRFVGNAGVRWDQDLGLYYMRERWFAQDLQHWLSRDPVWNTNLYAYCDNNPAKYVDPKGLQTCCPAMPAPPFTMSPAALDAMGAAADASLPAALMLLLSLMGGDASGPTQAGWSSVQKSRLEELQAQRSYQARVAQCHSTYSKDMDRCNQLAQNGRNCGWKPSDIGRTYAGCSRNAGDRLAACLTRAQGRPAGNPPRYNP